MGFDFNDENSQDDGSPPDEQDTTLDTPDPAPVAEPSGPVDPAGPDEETPAPAEETPPPEEDTSYPDDGSSDSYDSAPSAPAQEFHKPVSRARGVPEGLVGAVIKQESNGNPRAVSHAGAQGLMQVMPANWAKMGKGEDPFDPEANKRVGSAILQENLDRYSGNVDLALAAYNGGPVMVDRALRKGGYSRADARDVNFEDIAPFLTLQNGKQATETQDYVPGVRKHWAKMGGDPEPDNQSYSTGRERSQDPTAPSADERAGTRDELWQALEPIIADPEFNTLPTAEAFKRIKEAYNSKEDWTPGATKLVKELSSGMWDTAQPEDQINYGELVGSPPKLGSDTKNPKKALEAWKQKTRQGLDSEGVDTNFLGKQFDDYLDTATQNEMDAFNYRNRSVAGTAGAYVGSAASGISKGFVGAFASTAAWAPRLAGFKGAADAVEGVTDYIPDAPRDMNFQVDDNGYVKTDDYGRPVTKLQGSIMQAFGQAGSVFAGGGALRAAGYSFKAIGAFMGGFNTLQTMDEAYKDAEANGGTRNQNLLASVFSIPSAMVDTAGDLLVAGGGKAWIKGLSTANKARAIAGVMSKGALVEGGTESLQQFMQDVGTSAAIGKNILDKRKILESGIVGAVVGGPVHHLTTEYAQAPGQRNMQQQPPAAGTPPTSPRTDASVDEPSKQGPLPEAHLDMPGSEGQQGETKQQEKPVAEVDLPDPDAQVELAQVLERFQNSSEMSKVVKVRSVADVDPELLWNLGLRAEVGEDGKVTVHKETSHTPLEAGKDAVTIGDRIHGLIRKLAVMPHVDERQSLNQRRKDLVEQRKTFGPQAEAEAAVYEQHSQQEKALTKELADLHSMHQEHIAKDAAPLRELITAEIETKTNDLKEVRKVMKDNSYGAKLHAVDSELTQLHNTLTEMQRPTYINDRTAMENELRDLSTSKEIADANPDTNAPSGIAIEGSKGVRHIVPLLNKWHVTDETGKPLTKGYTTAGEAINYARGITENEQPAKFKQRVSAPWFITKPGKTDLNAWRYATGPEAEAKRQEAAANPEAVSARADGNSTGDAQQETPKQDSSGEQNPNIDARPSQPHMYRLETSPVNKGATVSSKFTPYMQYTQDSTKLVNPRELVKRTSKILKSLYKYGATKSRSNPYGIREGGREGDKSVRGKALAYIHYQRRYIWARESNDIPSVIHEAAHAIQNELFPDLHALDPVTRRGLIETAMTFYPQKLTNPLPLGTQLSEGWTMFMQHYTTGQPVHQDVLDFYNGKFKQDFPDLHKTLESLKSDVYDFYNMTPQTWTTAFTSATPKVNRFFPTSTDQFQDEWLNRMHVLSQIDAVAGTKIADVEEAIRGSALEKVGNIVNGKNFTDWNGNVMPGSMTLKQALAPARGMEQQLSNYAVAKYTLARAMRKQNTGLNLADAQAIIREVEANGQTTNAGDKYAGVKLAYQNMLEWQQNVMKLVAMRSPYMREFVESIWENNLKTTGFEHGYYIPFVREFMSTPGEYEGAGAPGASPFKSFKGSTKRILNPLTQLQNNASKLLAAAEKRYMFDLVVGVAKSNGPVAAFIRPIPRENIPTFKAQIGEMVDKLNKEFTANGLETIDLSNNPDMLENLVTFFRPEVDAPRAADGYQTFAYRQPGGNIDFYEVNPRLMKAFTNETPDFVKDPIFQWAFMKPARLLRAGATSLRPGYQLRNLLARDFVTAYRRAPGMNPVILAKEVFTSLMAEGLNGISGGKYKSLWTQKLEGMGAQAATNQGMLRDLDAAIYKKTGKPVINLGKGGFDYVEGVLGSFERATRQAMGKLEARRLGIDDISKPLTDAQKISLVLAYKRGTTNFQVQGSKARTANFYIPFFTARIAEQNQLRRDFKEHPWKNVAFAGSFLAIGFYQALSNKDEDWWQNIEPHEKQGNFLTTVGGKVVRIPLETVSALFNGIGSIIGESVLRSDALKPDVREQLIAYAKNNSPLATPWDILGPVLKEGAQQLSNEDFYTGRSIVPKGLEHSPKMSQFSASTAEVFKELGASTGQSPAQIEHLFKALMPASVDFVHQMENFLGVKAINEDAGIAVNAFTRSGYVESTMDRASNKFYETVTKYDQNKDIETTSEGETRKALNKLKKQVSDVNVVLSAEPDEEARRELYLKKRELLSKGLALEAGEHSQVSAIPQSTQAKQIRGERKQERASRLREALGEGSP